MSDPARAEQQRQQAYHALRAFPDWPLILQDLIQFAGEAQDAAVRCGRLDVITSMVDATLADSTEP